MTEGRTYRLAPRDRTGWVLGLSGPQVLVLGAALVVGVFASSHVGVALATSPVVAGAGLAFGRVGGHPLLEIAPPALGWALRRLRHRTTWEAPPPLELPFPAARASSDAPAAGTELALPPPLDGQRLLRAAAAVYDPGLDGGEIAVVCDPAQGSYTGALAVAATSFALTERAEQDRLLGLWGDALAGFCTDRSPVTAVRWAEWAAPAGLDDQLAYLAEHGHGDVADPAYASYRALLARAGPLATRHHVVVTVTVAARRVSAGGRHHGDQDAACTEALLSQLRLFAARMATAGLVVGPPLSPGELSALVRARLDPCAGGGDRPRSLADRAGHRRSAPGWPTRTDAQPGHWAVGESLHRVFAVAEWPRLDVPADWLGPLVLHAGAARTLVVVAEPVAPRRSHRAVERDATKLASDEEHRRSKGFRISAAHRRAQDDVSEREAQLVSGFGEFAYAGLVAVAAPDAESLERACDDLAQVAGGCGVALAPLAFRHDQGVGACLPLARGLAPSRAG